MIPSSIKELSRKKVGGSPTVLLAMFSAVQLATGEFIRNATPSLDITAVPSTVAVKLIIAFQVLPFFAFVIADFIIAARCSKTVLNRYRSVVLAVAIVLILRQIELYFAPAKSVIGDARSISPILLALTLAAVYSGAIWLTFKARNAITTYLAYFSPVALVFLLAMTSSQPEHNKHYVDYDFSEARHADSGVPVFVVVFDELAYEALLDSSGDIDGRNYPNFARLGQESLHLTDATSNYFRTWLQVPELIDSIVPLNDKYELRLYEQTHRIEALYAAGCGHEYTCRGLRYFARERSNRMASYVGMRAVYHLVPSWLETAGRGPLSLLARVVGSPPPPADPIGMHEISTALLDQYLQDVSTLDPDGRIFFLHTLLPHYPFVFRGDGEYEIANLHQFPRDPLRPLSEEEFSEIWEHYRTQIQYADTFLGDLISSLEKRDLYDEAIIIVTADHGARPLFPMWGEPIPIDSLSTNVPMFIRAPGIKFKRTDLGYQHIDFGATVADLVGHELALGDVDAAPGDLVSVSALARTRPQRERVFYVDDFPRRYWKYVEDESGSWTLAESVEGEIWDLTKLGRPGGPK